MATSDVDDRPTQLDPWSRLCNACTKRGLEPPKVDEKSQGNPHELTWVADVMVEGNSTVFRGERRRTKKEAKQSAAQKALDEMELEKQEAVGEAEVSSLDAVSALNLLTQELGCMVDMEVLFASSLFGFLYTLYVPPQPLTVEVPAEFTSKKTAKKHAAYEMLQKLLSMGLYESEVRGLLSRIPAREHRSARTPTQLVDLPSRMDRGSFFHDTNGNPLPEGRHLEFKGISVSESDEKKLYEQTFVQWVSGSTKKLKKGDPAKARNALAYVTAFLNTGIAGRLVLGVHDTGEVQGVPMSAKDFDKLSTCWADIQQSAWPTLPTQLVREIYLIDVVEPTSGSTSEADAKKTKPSVAPLARKLIVFEVLAGKEPPRRVYFYDNDKCVAFKKVDNTITQMTGEDISDRIHSYHQWSSKNNHNGEEGPCV